LGHFVPSEGDWTVCPVLTPGFRLSRLAPDVGRLDVAAQESQRAQVTATLLALLKQLAQQSDLLAARSGGFPSEDWAESSNTRIRMNQA
jgi:hypothetical protein